MTTDSIAQSYLRKCELRLLALRFYFDGEGWSDVVREAQELVELALKGMLRAVQVDPPRVDDVSASLVANRTLFPAGIDVDALARISRELRKDREIAFYGTDDLSPTDAYDRSHAEAAIRSAQIVLDAARKVIPAAA